MTNTIMIDLNTERDPMILFSKPTEHKAPTNKEEMSKMIIEDIAFVSEALTVLIKRADENEFATKESLIEAAIKTLNSLNENNG
jgi:tagatose-1,6-bisphosphate aldolase